VREKGEGGKEGKEGNEGKEGVWRRRGARRRVE
jgi:hypothetical protein